jgi:hypothetical protein
MSHFEPPPHQEVVSRIFDVDELRRVLVLKREDGFYSFVHETYFFEAPEDEGCIPADWHIDSCSGIYKTAQLAEDDARATVHWLRDASMNKRHSA